MGYDNQSRADKSNDNKKRIIACALALIDEKGFDNVSVREITEAAGVSKGAFYIHFKSKEDLIERQISLFYDEFKLDDSKPKFERLSYFLFQSLKHIQQAGLRMCQEWFSHSIKGSFYGKTKLSYDLKAIAAIVEDQALAEEIVSVYYGALNLWCFTDGTIAPEPTIAQYLNDMKEKLL